MNIINKPSLTDWTQWRDAFKDLDFHYELVRRTYDGVQLGYFHHEHDIPLGRIEHVQQEVRFGLDITRILQ